MPLCTRGYTWTPQFLWLYVFNDFHLEGVAYVVFGSWFFDYQDVTFDGGVVHVIDEVLTLPMNVSTTAVAANLTAVAGALTRANLVNAVDMMQSVTVFAPSNAAFQAIGNLLPGLDMEALTSILTWVDIYPFFETILKWILGQLPRRSENSRVLSRLDGWPRIDDSRGWKIDYTHGRWWYFREWRESHHGWCHH